MEFFKWIKIFKRDAGKRRNADGDDAERSKAKVAVHVTPWGDIYVDPEAQLRTEEAQAVINNAGSILESLKPSAKSSAAK